jgi:prepilin-type N-terminal cleavage/methylation domain-containing protein
MYSYRGGAPLKNSGGFTLLEVMIVLVVSSAMLISAMVLFGGQQRRVRFSQSMRDVESKIQDVINDVTTGYFPTTEFRCSGGASGPLIDTSPATPGEQGANSACLFVGKAIHFKENEMTILTLVGNRYQNGGSTVVNSFADSEPVIVQSLNEVKPYLWGTTLADDNAALSSYPVKIDVPLSGTNFPEGGLVIFASSVNSTGNAVAGNGQFNSGIQRVSALASGTATATTLDNVSVYDNTASINSAIFAQAGLGWVNGNVLRYCFEDSEPGDRGRQRAGIAITNSSAGLSAKLEDGGCR